jgi:hypothetical protein
MVLRRRTKLILALVVIIAAGLWIFLPNSKAKRRAERLRRELKAEGFKTELSEFSFSVPADMKNRADALITAGAAVRDLIPNRGTGFFQPVGSNAAIVLAKEARFPTDSSTDRWPEFRTMLEGHKEKLDAACEAAMAGPVRFEPARAVAGDWALPYLADIRSLSAALTARTLLELHDGHFPEARTNLRALTHVATGWDTEPVEMAYLVKFYCVNLAARSAWEAVQMHALTEAEIGQLLREWEALDAFKGLPDTAEVACASILWLCEAERKRPTGGGPSMRQAIGDLFDSPGRGWSEMTSGWRESRYRNYGAYEDELATMEFYKQREAALKKLTSESVWAKAQALDGMTNQLKLEKVTLSQLSMFSNQGMRGGFMRQRSLPSRAAEMETRRRLVCTGLALERFYLGHGSYPKTLAELAPAFVAPVDYMDGKPLRYRPLEGTNFIVYSTGLNCVDDGGIMQVETNQFGGSGRGFARAEEPDILWPRAATTEELESAREKWQRELP